MSATSNPGHPEGKAFAAPAFADRGPFRAHCPEYHGVLALAVNVRLIVSPNGGRYELQDPRGDDWCMFTWSKSLSGLRAKVCAPTWAALDVSGLPESPQEVHRPWADAMAAASREARAVSPFRDEYRGVIATSGRYRLILLPAGDRYGVQYRDAGTGWQSPSIKGNRDEVRAAIVRNGEPFPVGRYARSVPSALVDVCEALPLHAADWLNGPETRSEARRGRNTGAPVGRPAKGRQGRSSPRSGAPRAGAGEKYGPAPEPASVKGPREAR